MNQQHGYVTVKPKQSLCKTTQLTTFTSTPEKSDFYELIFDVVERFESISTEIEPIKVEGDTIRVKEFLMSDDKPYAIRYKGKDYVFIKSGKKTKVFELRD